MIEDLELLGSAPDDRVPWKQQSDMIVEATHSKRAALSWESEHCARPQTQFRVLVPP